MIGSLVCAAACSSRSAACSYSEAASALARNMQPQQCSAAPPLCLVGRAKIRAVQSAVPYLSTGQQPCAADVRDAPGNSLQGPFLALHAPASAGMAADG